MRNPEIRNMSKFQQAEILIVGGAGFVGSNLLKTLLQQDVTAITVVDNLLSADRRNLPDDDRLEFIEGSIADDSVLQKINDRYDYVFHLATFHGNQNSIHDPLADHENNTLTTLKLFECLKSFQTIRKVVYSGAGCAVAAKTFDDASATTEDASVSIEMDSPYSISKIIGEFYAVYYHRQHTLPTVRARFQNVYGPGEILGAGQWRGTNATVWRNVTPTFVYKAIHGQALPVEGSGEATRDFIFVQDIVNGLMACALNGTPGDVYNLASGRETSICELASWINELTGNQAPIDWRPGRDWDRSGKRFGSVNKAAEEIGFRAEYDVRKGLAETVEWTREHLPLIESCIVHHERFVKAA